MSIPESVSAHIAARPESPALIWQRRELTYGELGALVHDAGSALRDLTVTDGIPVAILARKSPQAIALILACLAARRPFLLLSVDLGHLVRDELAGRAGCSHLLAPGPGDPPFTAVPLRAGARIDAGSASPALAPGTTFLLTTSGSTGLPKIVPISAAAAGRFTAWGGAHFGIQPGRAVLSYAPLNFDLCLLDVWTTLAWGACVVLVDQHESTRANRLLDLIDEHTVRLIQAVPLFYQLVVEAVRLEPRQFPGVEHLVITGDTLPLENVSALAEIFPAATLHNLYGCTETNDSLIGEIDLPDALRRGALPLGGPLPGVQIRLMSADGEAIVGPGIGELWVSTPFQTAGYLDAALDGEKFVADAGDPESSAVFFRTGDVVRRHEDGALTIEGRRDFQVKVHGVRINLQEIEAVLLAHPHVLEAVVVAAPEEAVGYRLHALVRSSPRARINGLTLREHCAARLPRPAIPSTMRIIDESLPRTSTGKIDRTRIAEFVACPAN